MTIRENISLQRLNTFNIEASAERLVAVRSVADLIKILDDTEPPYHILGGGSNILLTQDVDGLVLKNEIGGVEVSGEDDHAVLLTAGGGVGWHELVLFTLDKNLGGLENLSLIPGTVGAAPIQNIGAYGVELQDVFHQLDAVDLETGERMIFKKADCHFGYRDSIFKREWKGRIFITAVTFRLSKKHTLHVAYGDIQKKLTEAGIEHPTIRDVSEAVVAIRRSKLPDPAEIGNAGSFFKNPEVPPGVFQEILDQHPAMPHFHLPTGQVKIPAGWLIEQAGWKGKRLGNAGCHDRQALVLVNLGGATGSEILYLAQQIQASVREKFEIDLMPEVNVW